MKTFHVYDMYHVEGDVLVMSLQATSPEDALREHSAITWGDTDGYFDSDRYRAEPKGR